MDRQITLQPNDRRHAPAAEHNALPSGDTVSSAIARAIVTQLYAHSTSELIASALFASILVATHWSLIAHPVLLVWWNSMVLLTIGRVLLTSRFKTASAGTSPAAWFTRHLIGVALSGIGWGTAGILLFLPNSVEHQAFLCLVLAGMVAGAAPIFAASRRTFLAFALPTGLPIIATFLLSGDQTHLTIGVAGLIFLGIMTGLVWSINRGLVRTFALSAERNQAKTELLALFDSTHDLIHNVAPDGRLIFVNRAWRETLGYSAPEAAGQDVFDVLHPDSQEHYRRIMKQILAGENVGLVELTFRTKSGCAVIAEGHVHLHAEEGRPIATRGIFCDITRRKTAEAKLRAVNQNLGHLVTEGTGELRESEALYRNLVAMVPGAVYEFQIAADGRRAFSFMSQGITELIGLSPDECMANADAAFQRICPDALPAVETSIRQSLENLSPWLHEFPVSTLSGETKWLRGHSLPHREENGTTRWHGVLVDITARKQAEDALLISQERFNLAVQGSQTGIWDWDLRTNKVYFSPLWKQQLGYEDHELCGHFEEWERRLHPDDRDRALTTVHAYLDGRVPHYELEHRLRHKDGSYRWILARGISIHDEQGTHYRMAGSHIDISDRKQAEEALLRHTQEATAMQQGLLALARLDSERLSFVEAVRRVTQIVSHALHVDRISVWLLSEDGTELVCEDLYECGRAIHSSGTRLTREKLPCYFAALTESLVIAAEDACHDPRTSEFTDSYLNVLGITSMLGVPIRREGKLIGVICCEHIGPCRRWTPDIQTFGSSVADTVTLLLEAAERKRAEKRLRTSQDLFAKAFRSSPNPISITEVATGHCVDVNDAWLELFGYRREDVSGNNALPLSIWPDAEDRTSLVTQLQAGKPVRNLDLNFRTQSGKLHHFLVSSDLIELNNTLCVLTICNDITERKQAEAALRDSQDQIRQMHKMEALGQLAGGIAHDFNNVLTAILGNAEIAILKTEADAPSRPNLARILEAGQRASHVVQQILTFTRQQDVSRTVLSLAAVVTDAFSLLRATLPAGLELTYACDAATLRILANATQLEQVLMNLCTNAWHALGDKPGRIVIEVAPVTLAQPLSSLQATLPPGYYARLSVRDTGCGMSPETIARIFDPFFTTKPLGQGTGLGLSVVHGIVEGHHGAIIVESAPGQGTAFHLYFPAVETPAPASETRTTPPADVLQRPCRVLYLDDEEMLVELVRALFEPRGYRITGCTKPAEALALVRADPDAFDAVVTDYNMPKMSGLEVARELAQIRRTLPVVLVSGYLTPEDQATALAAEVKEIIHKPTMLQELGTVLTRLLDRPPGA